jgi:hypothetical protein
VPATFGSDYPATGHSFLDVFLMEAVLTLGLVSVILCMASGAQNVGVICGPGWAPASRWRACGAARSRGVDEPSPHVRPRPGRLGLHRRLGLRRRAADRSGGRGRCRVRAAWIRRADAAAPRGSGNAEHRGQAASAVTNGPRPRPDVGTGGRSAGAGISGITDSPTTTVHGTERWTLEIAPSPDKALDHDGRVREQIVRRPARPPLPNPEVSEEVDLPARRPRRDERQTATSTRSRERTPAAGTTPLTRGVHDDCRGSLNASGS